MANLVPLTLLFLVLLIIPGMITFIYLKYYNHQINKNLTIPRKHKLLRPIWVLIITFLLEVVITFSISYKIAIKEYNQKINSNTESKDRILYIHTGEEIENSIYAQFNGENVSGYDSDSYVEDNYIYTIYHNNDSVDSISPYYMIYIQYTGNASEYVMNIQLDWNETVSREGKESKEYYIVFNDESNLQIELENDQDQLSIHLDN